MYVFHCGALEPNYFNRFSFERILRFFSSSLSSNTLPFVRYRQTHLRLKCNKNEENFYYLFFTAQKQKKIKQILHAVQSVQRIFPAPLSTFLLSNERNLLRIH